MKSGAEIIVQFPLVDKLRASKSAYFPPVADRLLVCLCLLLFGCEVPLPNSKLENIQQQNVLRVGVQYGITRYYNGASQPQGFEYEMARGFADHLGVKLEVYPFYQTQALLTGLNNGNIDLIASNIKVSAPYQQQLSFSPAYQTTSQKLVYLQGKQRPRNFQQLQGQLVVAADGSNTDLLKMLRQLEQGDNRTWQLSVTEEKDEQELLQSIVDGSIDYTIVDTQLLALARRQYPELSIAFTVNQDIAVSWALAKTADGSLQSSLVEYFGIIRQNGTLSALEDKYFGHVKQFNYVDTTLFLKAAKTTLPQFENWFKQYAGDLDWRLLAAMSYQESHWNPKAKSPTGVRGMMMLTLPTARDWKVTSRLDPEQSIRGGSNYFHSLVRRIPDRIQSPDRIWFALAAYNIGLGHLEDARVITQRMGANPDLWVDVKQHLPLLRQKRHYKRTRYGYARGNEAVAYVANIRRYYDSLVYLYDAEGPRQIAP